jgi:hypothetical protein
VVTNIIDMSRNVEVLGEKELGITFMKAQNLNFNESMVGDGEDGNGRPMGPVT